MIIRALTNQSDRMAAEVLVEKVCVAEKEGIGCFTPQTRWHIETRNQLNTLDPYRVVAIWFGAFEGNEIIGCLRQTGRVAGHFDFEHRYRLPNFLRQDTQAVEISRMAILPNVDVGVVLNALFRFSFEYGVAHAHSFHFTSGAYPTPGRFYIESLGMQIHGTPLAVDEAGAARLHLFYLDLRDPTD